MDFEEKIKTLLGVLFYVFLIASILGLVSQFIWNEIISDIFSIRHISFSESVLINLLFRIYFQNFNVEKD
jgi:hypothetical protein